MKRKRREANWPLYADPTHGGGGGVSPRPAAVDTNVLQEGEETATKNAKVSDDCDPAQPAQTPACSCFNPPAPSSWISKLIETRRLLHPSPATDNEVEGEDMEDADEIDVEGDYPEMREFSAAKGSEAASYMRPHRWETGTKYSPIKSLCLSAHQEQAGENSHHDRKRRELLRLRNEALKGWGEGLKLKHPSSIEYFDTDVVVEGVNSTNFQFGASFAVELGLVSVDKMFPAKHYIRKPLPLSPPTFSMRYLADLFIFTRNTNVAELRSSIQEFIKRCQNILSCPMIVQRSKRTSRKLMDENATEDGHSQLTILFMFSGADYSTVFAEFQSALLQTNSCRRCMLKKSVCGHACFCIHHYEVFVVSADPHALKYWPQNIDMEEAEVKKEVLRLCWSKHGKELISLDSRTRAAVQRATDEAEVEMRLIRLSIESLADEIMKTKELIRLEEDLMTSHAITLEQEMQQGKHTGATIRQRTIFLNRAAARKHEIFRKLEGHNDHLRIISSDHADKIILLQGKTAKLASETAALETLAAEGYSRLEAILASRVSEIDLYFEYSSVEAFHNCEKIVEDAVIDIAALKDFN
jgi:hypothetical protein